MTESLFAIGAGDLVVGRTRYCDAPKEALTVPIIGGFADPDAEAIVHLRPTMLIGPSSPALEGLRPVLHDATIFSPPTNTITDIEHLLTDLGEKTNHRAEADAVVTKMKTDLAEIDAMYATSKKTRVLMVFGAEPLVVAGQTGFASDMLAHVATENIVSRPEAYTIIDAERAQALRPDVLLLALGDGSRTIPPTLRTLPVVLEKHIVYVEDARILRPGPRVIEGLRVLGEQIHPH